MILITFLPILFAYTPLCNTCKFYIPNKNGIEHLGLCKIFKETIQHKHKEVSLYNFAVHCRNDEKLCGKNGFLYEEKKELVNDHETITISGVFEELNNRCCGEVNETDEIEELEREFFEIFKKIQKYNKQHYYGDMK